MTEIWKLRLAMIGTIGFTYSFLVTIITRGLYAQQTVLVCGGLLVALLIMLAALSMPEEKPERRRFRNGRILL